MYEIKNVPRFIANLRIGKISSNLRKKHPPFRNWRVGKISE